MIKALNDKGERYMLSYQNFSPLETKKGTLTHSKLVVVLEEIEDLFTEPTSLLLRLWQVYQVVQVVTGKTRISFPKRLVYTK